MKKILLATTILGASAGFAAADVAVTGSARMGVVDAYDVDAGENLTVFSSRVRMSFSGSGTTDGGLAFGGKFDAQDTAKANAGVGGSVFISGAFGKISMGDVDGGDEAAVGQLASVGYEGLGSTNSINYASDGFTMFDLPALNKTKAPTAAALIALDDDHYYSIGTTVVPGAPAKVLYTYAAGGLTVNASASQISNGAADHSSYGLGVAYTTGGLTVAAGYGSNDWAAKTTVSKTAFDDEDYAELFVGVPVAVLSYAIDGTVTDATVSATYVMGDTTLKAIYQDTEVSGTVAKWEYGDTLLETAANADYAEITGSATTMGASVQHKIGALTLTAFGVSTDLTTDMIDFHTDESVTVTRTGLGASYDLGGGATLAAGVANIEIPTLATAFHVGSIVPDESIETVSYTAYDIGVKFAF